MRQAGNRKEAHTAFWHHLTIMGENAADTPTNAISERVLSMAIGSRSGALNPLLRRGFYREETGAGRDHVSLQPVPGRNSYSTISARLETRTPWVVIKNGPPLQQPRSCSLPVPFAPSPAERDGRVTTEFAGTPGTTPS